MSEEFKSVNCGECDVLNQVPEGHKVFNCFECMARNTIVHEDKDQVTVNVIPAEVVKPATPKPESAPSAVPDIMAAAAETFKQRNKLYGNSYKDFDVVMKALFPDGLTLKTPGDWQRFGVLFFAIGKLVRYCKNFEKGGHKDSAHDLGVYSFMLEELTNGD